MTYYSFLNNIYKTGEMPEEWKNNIVTSAYKEGDKKKRWKIIEELAYLMQVIYYIVKF
jgi:hypothetical protein